MKEKKKLTLFIFWDNRSDKVTTALAVVGTFIALAAFVWQIWEHRARARAESPSVALTGRFCHVLTQEQFRDVLNALYDSWPLMSIQEREFRTSTNILATLREQFCDGSEFRLFRVVIQSTHNVPASLSDLRVRDLRVKSSNTNLIVRSVQVFGATGEKGAWETYPIVNLGPHETRQVDVVVSFLAVDQVADGTEQSKRPQMSVAEWRGARFSQTEFQSVRFAIRDNIGREYLSNVIPIHDNMVAE